MTLFIETEDIKVIVELENPRKFKDLRAIIVTKIIDPSQDLRKKLIQTYELTTLEADSVIAQDEQFYLTMVPKRSPAFQKILEDISNENLGKVNCYCSATSDPIFLYFLLFLQIFSFNYIKKIPITLFL